MFLVRINGVYVFRYFKEAVLLLCVVCLMFFFVDRVLLFYYLFEASLFPTLYLILKWGYQPERVQAGMYFLIYTICASLPLLFSVLVVGGETFNFSLENKYPFFGVVDVDLLLSLGLVMAFLVKIPMWGVHLWLPKAHVEAPVRGSMILAGVLLKLGGYGLIKIVS